MSLPQKIRAILGIGALAYTACATPQIEEVRHPAVKTPVDDFRQRWDFYQDLGSVLRNTKQEGEPFGESNCLKVREYETSHGKFAVVMAADDILDRMYGRHDEALATDHFMRILYDVIGTVRDQQCRGLVPQEMGSALVLDESTILIPYMVHPGNDLHQTRPGDEFLKFSSLEEAALSEGIARPYSVTPQLKRMITEAADKVRKDVH